MGKFIFNENCFMKNVYPIKIAPLAGRLKGGELSFLIRTSCFLLLCVFSLSVRSQNYEGLARQAGVFFENKNFPIALDLYGTMNQQRPNDAFTLHRMGVCYFEVNQLKEAEDYLFQSLHFAKYDLAESYLYLGKVYHAQLEFEKAISHYKLFLKNSPAKHAKRQMVKDEIRRCALGMIVRRQPPIAEVVQAGDSVNSEMDECNPLPSPNFADVFYFASDRAKNARDESLSHDIYFTEKDAGVWGAPEPLGLSINSAQNELPLGFNEAGDIMFFFRGNSLFSGDVLVDTFSENRLGKKATQPQFESPIRAWEGDCDPYFFNDTCLLFASRRPGGFGGLDIYITTFSCSSWSVPENLGPVINSAYDDRSPFLAPDGRTLYFSTNDSHRSIGGMDLLKSVFLDQVGKWTPPENLGFPFNSAGDEVGFRLTANGILALFASSRKTALGQRDIYLAYFTEKQTRQLQHSDPTLFSDVHPLPVEEKNIQQLSTERASENFNQFELHPIVYENPQMPFSAAAESLLEKYADWLKKYPQLNIVLVGYAKENDGDLLLTRTALQQAAFLLEESGVDLKQLKLLTVGEKYSGTGQGQIDLFVANPEILSVPIQARTTSGELFQKKFFIKSMSSLVYQVRIPIRGATTIAELRRFYPQGMVAEFPATGQVWFTLGHQLSWDAVLEAEQEANKLGFAETFVSPLLNGWELTKQEAALHLHEFPELANFIGKE